MWQPTELVEHQLQLSLAATRNGHGVWHCRAAAASAEGYESLQVQACTFAATMCKPVLVK